MNQYLKKARWYWDKYWTTITIYQVIVCSGLLWLIGAWLWIIPVYQINIDNLNGQNKLLQDFLAKNNQSTKSLSPEKIVKNTNLTYDHLLNLVLLHQLSLKEYKEDKISGEIQYQIIIKGSWLNTREFLNEFDSRDFLINPIHSLDIQRDKETNQIITTLLLSK